MASRKRAVSSDPEVDHRPATKLRLSPSSSPASKSPVSLLYPQTSQSHTRPVPFQQPSSLLTFSYTDSRELQFNDSAMRYYVEPPPRAELGYGYDRWVRRPDAKGRLDGLLEAFSKIRSKDGNSQEVGVLSWRGVMTKILTAPYEERDAWELNVMLRDGTLYFEEHLTDARLQEKNEMAPHQRIQTYYGYAFESWCTASDPHSPPGWGGDVDTNVQWCSVVKTKLGSTRMVIGGEVDCVRDKYDGRNDSLVELKTSMNIRGPQDEARFEKKLLKFYFQSFLLGVPEIIVGFRTPKGQLTALQSFKTMQIPRMVRGKPGAWDPHTCLEWGEQFLSWLRVIMSGSDHPSSVWRVKFAPCVGVEGMLLDEEGVREVEAGEDRVGFLPLWYWHELENSCTGSHLVDSGPSDGSATATAVPPGWQI
ncbi:RAI1-domain-containing protein [Artomyces pyxidatus]|uniref:RAI1-domain-containing protein n=1 Tax=Artomyces pyxidatus TaxID=48021 RepID=A0ACB8TFX5_9AGAM|nr:RAI1-domain-containing protein [Artomyces pyxidatus]